MSERPTAKMTIGSLFDLLIPLFIVALLIALCVQLLAPFVGLLLWMIILAICFYPIHRRLTKRGMSNRLSASIIGVALSALILVPTSVAAVHAASSVPALVAGLRSGEQQLPPPPARLSELPVVGPKLHAAWSQAANDMPAFAKQFGPQLADLSRGMLSAAGGMVVTLLGLLLAVILAAITLAYAESARTFTASILARVTGNRARGEHYMGVIGETVKSVANGVIGVAFVQALLCGIGFFLVGIPGAGILSLLAMVLGVLQIPVIIVTLPAIIYAFAMKTTTVAIIFTIWFIIGGLSDAVLKPLLIGHGLEVPMPVILLGVIGGVIAFGLVGLFVGAVLLAVGYVLMLEWLHAPAADGSAKDPGTLQAAE